MAFGRSSNPSVEADDLSSISCISRHFVEEASRQAPYDDGQERFENEFDGAKRKYLSSMPLTPPTAGNDDSPPPSMPTELFLPVEWCHKKSNRNISSSSSSWCSIPYLKQYPPFLRALFIVCFLCIVCAIGLIVFAVVAKARGGASHDTTSARSFDINDWGNSSPSNGDSTVTVPTPSSGASDIFVQGNEGGNGANAGTVTVASPSAGSTAHPTAPAAAMPTGGSVFYPTPAGMAKKKQMGMNKTNENEKGKKSDKDESKKGKEKDRRIRNRHQRKAREMRPSLYPDRGDS